MRKWLKSGSTASQNATVWSAIKAGTHLHARMIFTDQNITLEDQDISIDSGLTVNDIFNGDTDLVFGKTVCRQITVRILNSDRISGLGWTGEFKLQMWATISNVEYTCDIGYFKGKKPKNVTTAQYINFTAYDRMKLFDELADEFWNSLTFPKTISQIYTALVSSVGLTGVMDNVPSSLSGRSFASVPADMAGYAKRDILGWIAEQCASYAVITYEGKCSLKWFTDNTSHAVTGDQEWAFNSADLNPGYTHNELDQMTHNQLDKLTHNDIDGYKSAYAVEELIVKQQNSDVEIKYPINYGENIYTIINNPFVVVSSGSDITNYVKPIFDRLEAFGGYLPFEMSCLGDPAVEAGDIITVDIGDTTLTVPVFVKTMRWNGDITDEYETTGQTPRASYSSNAQKEQYLGNKSLRMFVDSKYYAIKSGVEITEDGVQISGGSFIDMLSGSEINMESGSAINIKSGGSLRVSSGGSFNVDAYGSLKLHGSTVKIDSGSTFDLQSANMVVNSTRGEFRSVTTTNLKKLSYSIGRNYDDSDSDFVSSMYPASSTSIFPGQPTVTTYNILWEISDKVSDPAGTRKLEMRIGTKYLKDPRTDEYGYQEVIDLIGGKLYHSDDPYDYDWVPVWVMLNTITGGYASITTVRTDTLKGEDVYYNRLIQNSSHDIKHNINPLPSVGEKLDQLKPVTFVYDDDKQEKTRMGLIYEDTMEVMPEICTDDESNKAISYIELVPALLKEIQDLRKRVAELERRD